MRGCSVIYSNRILARVRDRSSVAAAGFVASLDCSLMKRRLRFESSLAPQHRTTCAPLRKFSTSRVSKQQQQSSRHDNGMSFAASPSSKENNNNGTNANTLVPLDYHVTAWYRPEGFDMTIVYNVLKQLAQKQQQLQQIRLAEEKKKQQGVGQGKDSAFPPIKLTCSFPSLPGAYMAMTDAECYSSSSSSSPCSGMPSSSSAGSAPFATPPSFVTSPLLSHVEFLSVSMYVPIAQLFATAEDEENVTAHISSHNTNNNNKCERGGSPHQMESLDNKLAAGLAGDLNLPHMGGRNGLPAYVIDEDLYTQEGVLSSEVCGSLFSTASLGDANAASFTAAPATAAVSRSFLYLQPQQMPPSAQGGGKRKRDLTAAATTDTNDSKNKQNSGTSSQAAEDQDQQQQQRRPQIKVPLLTFAGTPAPLGTEPMTFIIFKDGSIVGWNAPWSEMLTLRNLLSITLSDVKRESAHLLFHETKVSGSNSATTATTTTISDATRAGRALSNILFKQALLDKHHGVVTLALSSSSNGGGGGGGASAFSSSSSSSTLLGVGFGEKSSFVSQTSATLSERVNASLWSAVSGFTSLVTPSSWGREEKTEGLFSSSSSTSKSSTASFFSPSFYVINSGVDTMRFNYFDRYPNAQAAAYERREQLEESGDWHPGADLVPSTLIDRKGTPSSLSVGTSASSAKTGGVSVVSSSAESLPPLPSSTGTPLYMKNFVDADKDYIVLAEGRDQFKVPFSYALAQSVKLDAIDHSIAPIANHVKGWQQRLAATGQLACGVKSLRRTKTRLLSLIEALNFKNNAQTTPKVFWAGELQYVRNGYKDACEHLEIEDRREMLQSKMDTVDESLTYLHDEVHANMMEFLTWVIIWLIAFEIAVAFGALHAVSVVWGWTVKLLCSLWK